jgi:hypothetical protein
LEEHEEELS